MSAFGFSSQPISDARMRDAQWVSKLKMGDTSSIGCLIEAHRSGLTSTTSNILRDPHEAEDVVQEAFLKAFREIYKLRDETAFKKFLYRIAVRLCLDRMRSKRAEPTDLDYNIPQSSIDIDSRIQIEKILLRLPPELRTTLVLREVQQLDYDEIADVMRVPVGTVRSRLHSARERFRKMWLEGSQRESNN